MSVTRIPPSSTNAFRASTPSFSMPPSYSGGFGVNQRAQGEDGSILPVLMMSEFSPAKTMTSYLALRSILPFFGGLKSALRSVV